jgi:hypothetical protein
MQFVVFECYSHLFGVEVHHHRRRFIRVRNFVHDLSLDIRSGLAEATAGSHKPDEYDHQEQRHAFCFVIHRFLLWLKMSIWGFLREGRGKGYGLDFARPKSTSLGHRMKEVRSARYEVRVRMDFFKGLECQSE